MSIIQVFGELFDVSFNEIDLSTKGFNCYNIAKPLSPQQTQELVNIPKRQGLIQATKKFINNSIVLYGFIKCDTYSELTTKLGELASFLYSDTDKKLVIQSDRYWNCQYLDSYIVEQRDDYALVNLEFTCNDPFGYATIEDSKDFEITTNNDIKLIINSGHYYCLPTFTITFNQTQTHIYIQSNNVSGNRLDIAKSFANGDELEIDCKNKTIKLNGSNSPTGFGSGGNSKAEFIKLAKGYNEIQIGTDDDTIDVSVNLKYRKVYLY